MCGISGIFSPVAPITNTDQAALRAAASLQAHRGPDEDGFASTTGFCAAHNRLSIIDLTTGQQPMHDSETGNIIVFNGEIYNYVELRKQLLDEGLTFHTGSDTEVLLKAYAQYGLQMFDKLNGMFAFAIYNSENKSLLLARDRFGEKPLYYFSDNEQRLCFASELQALSAFPSCPREIDKGGLLQYFAAGFIKGPQTIQAGVSQLREGHYVLATRSGLTERCYYRLPIREQSPELTDLQIGASLSEAIGLRLRADVPVATLLSGGLDSSLIAVLAQRRSERPLHSFAFGWTGAESELPQAKQVASLAGTIHHEITLGSASFANSIEHVVAAMDMPLADSAAFVVHELSKAIAAHGVKVVLSGEGGDELFGGYNWYVDATTRGHKLKRFLRTSERNCYDYVVSKFAFDPVRLVPMFGEDDVSAMIGARTDDLLSDGNTVNGRIGYDYRYFLPWALMPKVDRMSMAHSVEVRAPFLDHELVKQWLPFSARHKVRSGRSKDRIKRFCVSQQLLPEEIVYRRKMGMNLPLSWWIRENPSVFRDVIFDRSSSACDYFERSEIEAWFKSVANEVSDGWSKSAQRIWSSFTFELWRQRLVSR